MKFRLEIEVMVHLGQNCGSKIARKTLYTSRARRKALLWSWRRFTMADYYLLKTEPTEYSFADLQKDKETVWDGVHNPVALRNLGEMKPGTKLIIYETADVKSAVGMATVTGVDVSNPRDPQVKVKAGKAIAKPVPLSQIKADKLFADSPLVRIGRLSVVPLTAAQFKKLTAE
jgi:predicted RNA-binding protein with PUA-like domain